MLQGNPEGFKSPLPTAVQELVIAYIHELFRIGKSGFSVACNPEKEVLKIFKEVDGKDHAVTLYFDAALHGGLPFLVRIAEIIEESVSDYEKDALPAQESDHREQAEGRG
jgi:hypothetical protein